MNNAAWWARVVQARTEHDGFDARQLWTLHKGTSEAAIVLQRGARRRRRDRADGGRRAAAHRLYRSHEQAELFGAIADTRAAFEEKGWA